MTYSRFTFSITQYDEVEVKAYNGKKMAHRRLVTAGESLRENLSSASEWMVELAAAPDPERMTASENAEFVAAAKRGFVDPKNLNPPR